MTACGRLFLLDTFLRSGHTLISLELRTVYTVPVASGGGPERHPCDEAET